MTQYFKMQPSVCLYLMTSGESKAKWSQTNVTCFSTVQWDAMTDAFHLRLLQMLVWWPGVWRSHINERASNTLGLSPGIMLGLRQRQPGKLARSSPSRRNLQCKSINSVWSVQQRCRAAWLWAVSAEMISFFLSSHPSLSGATAISLPSL